MQKINIVDCCDVISQGRVFDIEPKNKMRRVLVFLDECPVCGQSAARIKEISHDFSIKTTVKRTGKEAERLFNKFKNYKKERVYKVKSGSRANMSWLWFDGAKDNWIRDFNNTKVFQLNCDDRVLLTING